MDPLFLSLSLPMNASTPTFRIPRRFDPRCSLLGRGLRRLVRDPLRAEAYFVLALAGLALGWLLAQYAANALIQPRLNGPANPAALRFWAVQGGLLLFLVFTCAVGVAPATVVTCTPSGGLRLRQGRRRLALERAEIEAVKNITPLRYHRHERRYAATQAFVGRLRHDLLLLRTAHGPVVLGLALEDQAALRRHLEAARALAPEEQAA